MKHAHLNSVPNGSTGSIMLGQHRRLLEGGEESRAFWGRGRSAAGSDECNFGSKLGFYLDVLQTRLDGRAGFHSAAATRKLLRELDALNPDVVHIHNIHGYYVNVEMLFDWLVRRGCRVEWTLHDCWAFTGHCAHFTSVGCYRWRDGCEGMTGRCPRLGSYPKTLGMNGGSVEANFKSKKRIFTSLPQDLLTIYTPSQWLAGHVGKSFLSGYKTVVRRNEIHPDFVPTESDFRAEHGIGDKFTLLGVATAWGAQKGLVDFVRLAEDLGDKVQVVLVGLSKRQIDRLPYRVIGLPRTESVSELAALYTMADLHVQPSCEETYGMTVAESLACGTPVLVRRGTACVEAGSGKAIEVDWDYESLLQGIKKCINDIEISYKMTSGFKVKPNNSE